MMGGLDRSTVLREGLKALIERESAIRLAKIDYFRDDLPEFGERVRRHEVVMHPFVVGELACGNFSNP